MKNPGPVITVLMPVYNAERHLREAIESILNQSFSEFEFLIIDDGSTDASLEIIRSYDDPRIRLLRNEKNFGITYTLNRGIQSSSTELIARMDADDISYPERLERQYEYAQRFPDCSLFCSWVRRISEDGKFLHISGGNPDHYTYLLLFTPAGIFHPAVLYRKSAVMRAGMYSKKYGEDFNLWCKLVKEHRFCIITEPLVGYRSSESSLWRVTRKSEYEEAHKEQLIENIRFYTTDDYQLADYEIQFLRGNLAPVLRMRSLKSIVTCFRKLDYITECFLLHRDKKLINPEKASEAASHYKMLLVNKLAKRLKYHQVLEMLIRLRYWHILSDQLRQKINNKLRQKQKVR
jgi:glycosyltransferase involved in cell wall biosynthesis